MTEEPRVRTLKRVPEELHEAEDATGHTFYDMMGGFVKRLERAFYVLCVIAIAVLAWYLVGWYALTGVVIAFFVWYVAFMVYLTPRGVVVDVYNAESMTFDTWMIGTELFGELRKSGGLSPIASSKGTIRYVATALDIEAKTMTTSWMTDLSPFQYMVDMGTHLRQNALFESMLDKMLDKIGYPSVLGKLRACDVIQTFVKEYDGRLDYVSKKPEHARGFDVHPHEMIETPDSNDGSGSRGGEVKNVQ